MMDDYLKTSTPTNTTDGTYQTSSTTSETDILITEKSQYTSGVTQGEKAIGFENVPGTKVPDIVYDSPKIIVVKKYRLKK